MNLGILGGIAGVGEGMAEVGKRWHEDDVLAEKNRMDMEKEKRIEEAGIRAEGRQQNYQIASEARGLENKKAEMKNELAFNTNPENVQAKITAQNKVTQAELDLKSDPANVQKQMALKKAEVELQTAAQIAVHNATDTTDYAGRKLQNELNSIKLEQEKSLAKIPPAVKLQYDAIGNDIRDLHKENVNADAEVVAKNNKTIEYLSKQRIGLVGPYLPQDAVKSLADATKVEDDVTDIIQTGVRTGSLEQPKNYVEKQGVLGTEGLPVKQPEAVKKPPSGFPVKDDPRYIIKGKPTPEQQANIDSGKWRIEDSYEYGKTTKKLVPNIK